ncbi:MAG TPA: dihydrofolate reductase family protein [Phnomibacter sp.]|nr:dihydrofolate reductase family protein [Phnomibacter sp.]
MRKLKLQVQTTVDGYMGGPNGEMDWIHFPWTADINTVVGEINAPIGTILLGRKLAEGFIPHWANVAADANNPEYEAGLLFSNTPKIVFSNTLKESPWANTVIAGEDVTTTVEKLKQTEGGDIIAYGGSSFISSLIQTGLVDEYNFFINPSAIGKGLPIFGNLQEKLKLQFKKAVAFECGIAWLQYAKAES